MKVGTFKENRCVDFNNAKLLKERDIVFYPMELQNKTDYVLGYEYDLEDDKDELKIREFQWEDNICSHLYLMPEISEVVNYFREKFNLFIEIRLGKDENNVWYNWSIVNASLVVDYIKDYYELIGGYDGCDSPNEAYNEAIRYILNAKLI